VSYDAELKCEAQPVDLAPARHLFLAVICGCNAGLFREALREVYIFRAQAQNGGNVLVLDVYSVKVPGAPAGGRASRSSCSPASEGIWSRYIDS